MQRLKHILAFLAAGCILMFFSEFLFYGEFNPDAGPGLPVMRELIMMWGVYTGMAWLTLAILHIFRARSLPAVFLAGAVYGWILEGVVVSTVYEAFPTQIHFTALAWHAPLDVVIGFYVIPRMLRSRSRRPITLLSIALGIFWGFWAIWPWWDTGIPLAVPDLFLFSFTNTLCLILAYRLFPDGMIQNWRPSRIGLVLLSSLLVFMFVFQVLPAFPFALLLLPGLLGISLWALWKNRLRAPQIETSIDPIHAPRWSHLMCLMIFSVTTSIVYSMLFYSGTRIPVTYILYILSSIIGIAGYVYAVINLLKPGISSPIQANDSG
jgi:hypothetical protein